MGVGRSIRDEYGNWVLGFPKRVENDSVLQYELWAIFLGLNIVIHINMNAKIEIERFLPSDRLDLKWF